MDHASGPEEQEGFEEGVGGKVEHRPGECANAQSDEHIPQLAHRGVGQDFLDIILEKRYGCGKQGSGKRSDADHAHGVRREDIKDVGAGDHVHPGRDHRGCVDER